MQGVGERKRPHPAKHLTRMTLITCMPHRNALPSRPDLTFAGRADTLLANQQAKLQVRGLDLMLVGRT